MQERWESGVRKKILDGDLIPFASVLLINTEGPIIFLLKQDHSEKIFLEASRREGSKKEVEVGVKSQHEELLPFIWI